MSSLSLGSLLLSFFGQAKKKVRKLIEDICEDDLHQA